MASQSSEYLAILSSSASNAVTGQTKKTFVVQHQSPASLTKQQIPVATPGKETTKIDLSNFEVGFPSLSSNQTTTGSTSETKSYITADRSLEQNDNYGLEGLVSVVRSSAAGLNLNSIETAENRQLPSNQKITNPEGIIFSLGSDLSFLGLDLNSPEFLYTKFNSPWFDSKNSIENILPSCYLLQQNASSLFSKIPSFSEETLFFVFYGMPRDKAQLVAAVELYHRGWRYHRGLKLWFTKDPNNPQSTSSLLFSNKATLQTDYAEKGTFVFFDFTNWQRVVKEFTINGNQVEGEPVAEKINP